MLKTLCLHSMLGSKPNGPMISRQGGVNFENFILPKAVCSPSASSIKPCFVNMLLPIDITPFFLSILQLPYSKFMEDSSVIICMLETILPRLWQKDGMMATVPSLPVCFKYQPSKYPFMSLAPLLFCYYSLLLSRVFINFPRQG